MGRELLLRAGILETFADAYSDCKGAVGKGRLAVQLMFVLLEAKSFLPVNVLREDIQELALAATTLLTRRGKPNAW